MSFVGKAIKKVFKVAKRIVKKQLKFIKRVVKSDWFKVAVIIGITLFTAGVGSGIGFSAFQGAQGLSGFFSAVGQTMSAGMTSITGMVAKAGSSIAGIFGGTAAPAAAAATTTAFPVGAIGASATAASGAAFGSTAALAAGAEAVGLTAAATAGSGFLGTIGTLAKAVMPKTTLGKVMAFSAIQGGMANYQKQKELDKQDGYYRNRMYWGNAAYGADPQPLDMLQPVFAGDTQGTPQDPTTAVGAQEAGLLPFQREQLEQQQVAQVDRSGMQQGAMGVPGEQTQAPPATQPQQIDGAPPGTELPQNAGLLG